MGAARTKLDRHRDVLGVERGATVEELKQAYRDLVKVWHPDRFPNDPRLAAKAAEKLKEINAAYEALAAAAAARMTASPSSAASAAPSATSDGAGDSSPLVDFLEELRRR